MHWYIDWQRYREGNTQEEREKIFISTIILKSEWNFWKYRLTYKWKIIHTEWSENKSQEMSNCKKCYNCYKC